MPKITAPNESYSGVTAGVSFTDGTARVSRLTAAQEAYFARHGYSVEKPTAKKQTEPQD